MRWCSKSGYLQWCGKMKNRAFYCDFGLFRYFRLQNGQNATFWPIFAQERNRGIVPFSPTLQAIKRRKRPRDGVSFSGFLGLLMAPFTPVLGVRKRNFLTQNRCNFSKTTLFPHPTPSEIRPEGCQKTQKTDTVFLFQDLTRIPTSLPHDHQILIKRSPNVTQKMPRPGMAVKAKCCPIFSFWGNRISFLTFVRWSTICEHEDSSHGKVGCKIRYLEKASALVQNFGLLFLLTRIA